ncbi:hypothetical protein N7G274_009656 [Stereocaulon virgatum]|uniref:Deacetylase sirtuin-type domain-containing protein n=1 Tax=Stereocaulon virgatum TaxID=373712 RepID=A0ABR3ZVB2_9LECA
MPILEILKDDNRQLQNIANILAAAKKVVVITGAGISTNCGIPDFRSDEGLYSLIQAQRDAASNVSTLPRSEKKLPLSTRPHDESTFAKPLSIPNNLKGKDLFDCQLWQDPTSTSVFYTFIASLRRTIQEDVKRATLTHRFIRTLRDRQRLVRCYTQNIDGLESRLGLSTDITRGKGNRSRFTKQALEKPKVSARIMAGGDLDGGCEVVQLHGDLDMLRCTLCQQICQWKDKDEARLVAGKAPICHFCTILNEDRRDRGKRGTKVGTLRPNIVLYGEEHPAADAVGTIIAHDLALSPDVLLVLGTSLHVHGLKILVKEFAKAVHARANGKGKVIFVNLSKPSDSIWKDVFDYWVSMDCDEWVSALRGNRPDIWQIQRELKPSVCKGLGKLGSKAVPSPCLKPKAYEDKENVSLTMQGHKTSPPLVVMTPKKRPLQERPSSFMEQLNQAASIKPGDSTPVPGSSQLPTPPSSARKGRLQVPSAKRSRDEEDMKLVESPSKKRKAMVSIWEDPDTRDRRRQLHRVYAVAVPSRSQGNAAVTKEITTKSAALSRL